MHTALERGLLERAGSRSAASCGPAAAATTRSPPTCGSTCATAARLITARLAELETALMDQAQQHLGVAAPGLTHLQHAQPVLLSPPAAGPRAARWPGRSAGSGTGTGGPRSARSGPGALAGSSLPLDPETVAAELGFDAAAPNSMDAVSDRDFAAEFCFAAALLGVHLSRLGEEIVLWTSHEFGWAEIDDAYATGSSIMPQKKNPDVAELARGKAGRLIGGLTGLLTMLKGLPLTYNRDLQEDKEPVFDAVDTLLLVLPAMAGLISTIRFNTQRLSGGAAAGHALATDLAELLVRRGVPFREAHEVVGHLVVWCQVHECELADVSDADLARISPQLTPDVRDVLTVDGALAARSSFGGTARDRVAEQLAGLRTLVDGHAEWAAG